MATGARALIRLKICKKLRVLWEGVELHGLGNLEDRLAELVNVEKRVENHLQLEDHLEERSENDPGSSGKGADGPPGNVLYTRKFLNQLAPLIWRPTKFSLHVVQKEKEELISGCNSQLLQHFCRPPTDEVILQVQSRLDGTLIATIGSKVVNTWILKAKSHSSLEQQPIATPGLFGTYGNKPSLPPSLLHQQQSLSLAHPNQPDITSGPPDYLALVIIYAGTSSMSVKSILATPQLTVFILHMQNLSITSLSRHLESELFGDLVFRKEVEKQRKEIITESVGPGGSGTNELGNIDGVAAQMGFVPKLVVVWLRNGQQLNNFEMLGEDMFSVVSTK
ncbi:hypothetical protein BGX38DRAFT_1334867 [Terfezia claveryi]|nr:hypothetical protein BGX38DRAFT_1334867 [Terfezia claveryi]